MDRRWLNRCGRCRRREGPLSAWAVPPAATHDNLKPIRRYVERALAKLLWGELPHTLRCQAPRGLPKRRRWNDSR